MKIRKAQLIVADSDGVHRIAIMDVIEYDGKYWLVPDWLDNPTKTMTTPLRIVSMATMPHQHIRGATPEFVVNDPVPKYVFDGRIPPQEAGKYIVVENPDILIPLGPRLH